MKDIVGIRFKSSGKIYYFDPGEFKLENGMHVIVDTSMGEEYGEEEGKDSLTIWPLLGRVKLAAVLRVSSSKVFSTCFKSLMACVTSAGMVLEDWRGSPLRELRTLSEISTKSTWVRLYFVQYSLT